LNIIRSITSNDDIQGIFGKILEMSLDMTDSEKGFIVIYKSDKFETVASRNFDDKEERSIKLTFEKMNQNMVENDYDGEKEIFLAIEAERKKIGVLYIQKKCNSKKVLADKIEMIRFLITQVVISLGEKLWKDNNLEITIDEQYAMTESEKFNLTKSEKEVLLSVVKGFSNKEICDKAFISINTLRTHLKNIYIKTDIIDRDRLIEKFSRYKNF
jgi:DNA-binding CsgD family transcriptional regulator